MNIEVSEKIIEDILVIDKNILSEIIQLNYNDLTLLGRQKSVKSGILDLLYLWKDELILIELKSVPFYNKIVEQINGYYDDLIQLQLENKLVKGKIRKYIIVTSKNNNQTSLCLENEIELILFNPKRVLSKFYENFKELSQFLKIQSGDYGVVRLGLIISTLKLLENGLTIERIANKEGKSIKTIKNRLSVALQFNLVRRYKNEYFLTEMGEGFTKTNNEVNDRLNILQKEIIKNFIKEYPFYSSISYTIFSIVESVFVLSKNSYPVHIDKLKDYFVKSVGKSSTWKTEKSKQTATYIFSNYAIELDFLAKVDNEFFITPDGIQAILLLQLNRSIKLIENK